MHTRSFATALLLVVASLSAAFAAADVPSTPFPTTQVEGTMANESIVILPLDMSLARQIIPANYSIMTGALEAVMGPYWPKDKYPVSILLQAALHDLGVTIEGFRQLGTRNQRH